MLDARPLVQHFNNVQTRSSMYACASSMHLLEMDTTRFISMCVFVSFLLFSFYIFIVWTNVNVIGPRIHITILNGLQHRCTHSHISIRTQIHVTFTKITHVSMVDARFSCLDLFLFSFRSFWVSFLFVDFFPFFVFPFGRRMHKNITSTMCLCNRHVTIMLTIHIVCIFRYVISRSSSWTIFSSFRNSVFYTYERWTCTRRWTESISQIYLMIVFA